MAAGLGTERAGLTCVTTLSPSPAGSRVSTASRPIAWRPDKIDSKYLILFQNLLQNLSIDLIFLSQSVLSEWVSVALLFSPETRSLASIGVVAWSHDSVRKYTKGRCDRFGDSQSSRLVKIFES